MYKMLQKKERRNDIVVTKKEKNKTAIRYPYQYSDEFLERNARYYQNANIPKNNCSDPQPVVQRYKKMPNTYDNREIEWDSTQEEYGFWSTVDKGFLHAIICLTEVSKYNTEFIKQWSDAILQVLQNQDLEIYPIVNQNIFGQSEYNKMKISLEVNLLNGDVEQMAKTLIHEAFHIIGGCFKIENGNHVYDENLDTPNNSTNIPEMYQEMSQNSSNILNVRADTVAQYIMQEGSLLYVLELIIKNSRNIT